MAAAEWGHVLCDEATHRACVGARQLAFQPLPPIMVKGKEFPIEVYEPAARDAAAAHALGLERSAASPSLGLAKLDVFVGRDKELTQLEALFARVRKAGTSAAVVIEGEPGIGKSTLVHEFALQVPLVYPDAALVVRGSADSLDQTPYRAWREVISQLLRLHRITSTHTRELRTLLDTAVSEWLAKHCPAHLAHAPLLSKLLPVGAYPYAPVLASRC